MQMLSNTTTSTLARGMVVLGVATGTLAWLLAMVRQGLRPVMSGGPAQPEELLVAVVACAALCGVLWLALGTLLHLFGLVPGAVGRAARGTAALVTPGVLRKAVAVALGVGVAAGLAPGAAVARTSPDAVAHGEGRGATLVVGDGSDAVTRAAAPLEEVTAGTGSVTPGTGSDAVAPPGLPDPGWVPVAPTIRPQPDVRVLSPAPRPAEPSEPAREVVVQRGDTLWSIVARQLGPNPSDAEIAAAWPLWHAANRDVVGHDPDLILPGQVLRDPEVARR